MDLHIRDSQPRDLPFLRENNDALRLYRRHGFVEHADIGDTLLMVRRLRP